MSHVFTKPVITGIGSRDTPPVFLEIMTGLGEWCRREKITVRSGGAPGADKAFQEGAKEMCLVYEPWLGFSGEGEHQKVVIYPTSELKKLVEKYHPFAKNLKPGATKLMCRNVCQILGEKLDKPTGCVILWGIPDQNLGIVGGTGFAFRLALDLQIPILNLYDFKIDGRTKEQFQQDVLNETKTFILRNIEEK